MKNCPNCGAVIEPNKNECEYCGTSYFDLSAINFSEGKPIYLKIKTEMNGRNCYITQLVIPRLGDISMSTESIDITGYGGEVIHQYAMNRSITTNIEFEAINIPGKASLIEMEVKE